MDHDELHSHIHAETKSNTKENADVGLICSLNPNTTAVKHVLTFHSLFNHLLYRHLLYRHLLYLHWIIPKPTRPSLDLSFGSGTNNGQVIFPCRKNYGIFVRSNNVREHPLHGDPRQRKKRALDSLQAATALKSTLARMIAKHK